MNNLAVALFGLDRTVEAIEVATRAVNVCRTLDPQDAPRLAKALRRLAILLGAAGRASEALEAAEEATRIARLLPAGADGRRG